MENKKSIDAVNLLVNTLNLMVGADKSCPECGNKINR